METIKILHHDDPHWLAVKREYHEADARINTIRALQRTTDLALEAELVRLAMEVSGARAGAPVGTGRLTELQAQLLVLERAYRIAEHDWERKKAQFACGPPYTYRDVGGPKDPPWLGSKG